MNSFVKTFKYNKNGEVKEREVFIMSENQEYFAGLDFSYLTKEAQEKIKSTLSEHKVTFLNLREKSAEKIEGYNKDWNKGWRLFKKSNIIN